MSIESELRSSSQHVAYRGEAKEAARIHALAECHHLCYYLPVTLALKQMGR